VGTTRVRRAHRSWPQRALIAVNTLVVIACLATAGTFSLIRSKAAALPVVDLGGAVREQLTDDSPRNILLVGTDNADTVDPNDPITDGRTPGENLADVIMILRVDPKTAQASLLSIPRDTWVPIAPTWSRAKINSAFAGNDGSAQLIATIKHNFGISIDNYAQVNFGGFQSLIEVLGGIPVFIEHPVRDPATSLLLTATGCQVIEPAQALAYTRSRHLEYQEGDTYDPEAEWIDDTTSDLGRISRQQDFIRQAAQTAINQGIRNPTTALRLVNAALQSVEVDSQLAAGEVVELIQRFRTFSVEGLQAEQVPTVGGPSKTISYQEIVWPEAEGLFDIYRGIRAEGEVVPSDVIVGLPSTGATSLALAEQLDAIGFDASVDDSTVTASRARKDGAKPTVIRFGLRGAEAARMLARHLDGAVETEFDADLPGRRLELAPGTETPEVLATATSIDSVPMPTFPETTVRRTTTTIPATTQSPGVSVPVIDGPAITLPDVTTTTAIGFLPLNAAAAADCP